MSHNEVDELVVNSQNVNSQSAIAITHNNIPILSADIANLSETNSATDISTSGALTISDGDVRRPSSPRPEPQAATAHS